MLNKELISASVPILAPSDTVFQALQLMTDDHLSHLPVVEGEKLRGLVNEDQLLNVENDNQTIEEAKINLSRLAVSADLHFLEAVRLVNENGLSLIPVVEHEVFVGAITAADLLKWMGKFQGGDERGGVIILELDKRDFSFSQITKLVETNDAYITNLTTYSDNTHGVLYVTIKVNKLEISDIVSTFQRYEYHVKYYFGEELYENEIRNNYDHLMNYLNI